MTREQIIALFAQRDQAWQRRDAAALGATFAENAIAESPMQGRLPGRARIQEVYEQWFAAFPDLVYKSEDLIIDGHRVVQFFSIAGTQSAPFGGLAATGRKFQVTGAAVSMLGEDGLVTSERRVYDVSSMLIQLGALRAKPLEEKTQTIFKTT